MEILLHTIALEPARWTPTRVSQSLADLLPAISSAGFRELEVFEPHLSGETLSENIRSAFAAANLKPVILSSYLNVDPSVTPDSELDKQIDAISARVDFYGFEKVRIFPGPGIDPSDKESVKTATGRIKRLAERVRNAEILLETHDGSIADDPAAIVTLVEEVAEPHVGLLFQPTRFSQIDAVWEQIRLQKPHIRHIHLQNRKPDVSFAPMESGIVPWPEIIRELGPACGATLEFVSCAICPVEAFDLGEALAQARSEADYVQKLFGRD